jgi:aminomethyltransferase
MIFPADDIGAEDPKPTALFAAAASVATANSWTSINGWSVARAYSSVAEEYDAAHNSAVIADVGPIARYTARGEGAASFLARVTTAPVEGLAPGESARGLMLAADGSVADVVETARLSHELYLLVASRRHARRLQLAGRGLDAVVEDITGRIAALAIIGPDSRDLAGAAGIEVSSETLAAQMRVRGVETSARPIHFGALAGIEVIYPYEEALTLWERLRRARAPKAAGLDALEILRIEGGAPRPGVDFVSSDDARRDAQRRLPREIGLPHLAPHDRAWFNGRRALRAPAKHRRALVVLAIDADRIAPGAAVFGRKGAKAGRITSAAFSPRLKRVVAFADLAIDALAHPLEIAMSGEGDQRAGAHLFETPESRLAKAFRATAETRP